MLDFLNHLDTQLFLFINEYHNTFFDYFMVYVSSRFIWIPFYLFLFYLLVKEYRLKSLLILAFVFLLILTTDQLSVHAFKNVFERLRPCHNEELKLVVHTVTSCGGQYGFVSSHAANSFALAVFISALLSKINWIPWLMYGWAILISYSRIYLGKHYPGDVFTGAILGILIGIIVIILFRKTVKMYRKQLK